MILGAGDLTFFIYDDTCSVCSRDLGSGSEATKSLVPCLREGGGGGGGGCAVLGSVPLCRKREPQDPKGLRFRALFGFYNCGYRDFTGFYVSFMFNKGQ